MSGGAFDYIQCRHEFYDMPEVIARAILDSIENGNPYSEETIKELENCVKAVHVALVYIQRVDWLISGDDGEDDFHERLSEELERDK